jgi:DNA-binding MarR family transcriptional regulator
MQESDEYEVTWLVRRLFRAMADTADEYLAEFGITAADRAVLEFLSDGKPLTVPQIAARYHVSRQHVQVTVNRLADKALTTTRHNPRHKRSALIAISASGKRLFARVRRREAAIVEEIFAGIPRQDIQVTRRTLQSLTNKFETGDTP